MVTAQPVFERCMCVCIYVCACVCVCVCVRTPSICDERIPKNQAKVSCWS